MTAALDVLVIGAGFGGIYLQHCLREAGYRSLVVEKGDGVGGTWYWNRYPGARVDVEGVEYSYSFSSEIEQEWSWSETMPGQPEIEAYCNFVTDRLDLRRDMRFGVTVTAARWDAAAQLWHVDTEAGERYDARVVIAATGCLSAPLLPDIAGMDTFAGVSLFTNQYPRDGFDFTGKRVVVIGTGSSGVQAIPVIAETAAHLTVLQRSAAYTRPANNRAIPPEEMAAIKAEYPALRERQLQAFSGTLRFGAVTLPAVGPSERILDASPEERSARIAEMGWGAPWAWADIMTDLDANQAGIELYAELVRQAVHDPETAAALVPQYPLGCKRMIIDTDYYETYNRPNVRLVDLRKGGIEEVTPTGVQTAQGHIDADVIVYATGFDAMTGALNSIEIVGRDGRLLRDEWRDGPRTLLGLQVEGFPNFFTVTGPGSPAVHANMVMAVEQHGSWIVDCLEHLRANGYATVEATAEAQDAWVAHVAEVAAQGIVRTSPSCNSWYTGANVPGKPRVYLAYTGGLPAYRAHCDDLAAAGYEGFRFA